MKTIILLLLALTPWCAMADTPIPPSSLSGKVTDAVDNEPLIGVTLYIAELNQTTITDINGHYQFESLPQKTVTLQVSYVGHQTRKRAMP